MTFVAAAMAAAGSVHAQSNTRGAGAVITNRPCVQGTGTTCITGQGTSLYAGGLGSGVAAKADNISGTKASASAAVSFSDDYLPTIRVSSFSGPHTRTGGSADGFRLFIYKGLASINLVLTGSLHYINTGDDGFAPETATEGMLNANLAILPASYLSQFGTTGRDIIVNPFFFTACSNGASAAATAGSGGQGSGTHLQTISLDRTCANTPITIAPGQSFIVYGGLQAISNQGGYVDATHTFSLAYDPSATVFTDSGRSVGADFLAASIAPVPEPGSWVMLLGGFGITGWALRRRHASGALRA